MPLWCQKVEMSNYNSGFGRNVFEGYAFKISPSIDLLAVISRLFCSQKSSHSLFRKVTFFRLADNPRDWVTHSQRRLFRKFQSLTADLDTRKPLLPSIERASPFFHFVICAVETMTSKSWVRVFCASGTVSQFWNFVSERCFRSISKSSDPLSRKRSENAKKI